MVREACGNPLLQVDGQVSSSLSCGLPAACELDTIFICGARGCPPLFHLQQGGQHDIAQTKAVESGNGERALGVVG